VSSADGGAEGGPLPVAVLPLAAASYTVHALHREDRAWVQKNCYIDVWLEAVHALGLDPTAMLGFTVRLDFEGDQWTFFKPSHSELEKLYGIEVHELNVWRGTLLDHALHHLKEGRLVFTEADAWWLPDTAGTDYRHQHTKSTIVLNSIDVQAQRLGYFHNQSYYELQGEDFVNLFRVGFAPDPAFMPMFAEFARTDRIERLPAPELAAVSADLLRGHLKRLPATNPVTRFAERFPQDVAWLQAEGLPLYHGYAFATLRQLGANFELAALYLDWLAAHGETGLDTARAAFDEISSGAKALVLKTARAVHAKRNVDFSEMLGGMATAWDSGMASLRARYP
jgi:hypothetical protein